METSKIYLYVIFEDMRRENLLELIFLESIKHYVSLLFYDY